MLHDAEKNSSHNGGKKRRENYAYSHSFNLLQTIRLGQAISPNPRMLPMVECVVETGIPSQVETVTQITAASADVRLPRMRVSLSKTPVSKPVFLSTSPLSNVFITNGPIRIPPIAVKIAKRIIALRSEMTPAPTAHSVGLEASFAPKLHAIAQDKITPMKYTSQTIMASHEHRERRNLIFLIAQQVTV